MITCPNGHDLVEVDNPMRREFRHHRGVACRYDDRCLSRGVHNKPADYYGTTNPDGDQHCLECHCSCDPTGPHCGHWAGCPGC